MTHLETEALKAVVRRNTEQVQGQGDFVLFDELFADDLVDHTPQPGTSADKAGVHVLYKRLRDAFPDFRPEIHWQTVDGDIVTTYKIYHGTHLGDFLDIAPTGKTIQFETVDAMRALHHGATTSRVRRAPVRPLPRPEHTRHEPRRAHRPRSAMAAHRHQHHLPHRRAPHRGLTGSTGCERNDQQPGG
ncbi:MAG TPA: ester cyclase [Mycobacterium sp.]|nr:ester cyclase [Mycobacterium sp.]